MDHILIQRFDLRHQLVIEDIENGHEVIAEADRTIIRSDAESLTHDLPEMLSMAKLADIDPLLITFVSQSNPTEEELRYLGMFSSLCSPLKSSWIWGTMRRTVPDIYEREAAELYQLWEPMHDDLFIKGYGSINIDDPKVRDVMLPMWAILSENPENIIDIKLSGEAFIEQWRKYIAVMQAFIPQPPYPELFTILPDAAEAPYRVRIKQDNGFRYYDLTAR